MLNSGITGVSAVPSGSGVIYRPTTTKDLFPYVAGITAADQQTYNNYLIEMVEAISAGVADGSVTWPKLATAVKDSIRFAKRDTTIIVVDDESYIIDLTIPNPAQYYNNIDVAAISRTDTTIIAFLALPSPYAEYKGVTYNIKADSGIVQVSLLSNGAFSNSRSTYFLKTGQKAVVKALYDNVYGTERWKVEVMWDSSGTVSGVYLPILGGRLTGTGGAGFIGFPTQSSNPSTPASGFNLFAGATGAFTWKGANGYARIFDGLSNTADRTYTLQNSSGTLGMLEATQSWTGANSYTNSLSVSASPNGFLGYNVTNTNSGTAAIAGLNMVNNGGNTFTVGNTAQNYSGLVAGGHAGLIQNSGGGGLALMATNGSGTIRFAAGGSTEQARLHSSGRVTIGTAPSSEISLLSLITAEGPTLTPAGGLSLSNTNTAGVSSIVFYNGGVRVGDFATTGSTFTSGATGLVQANQSWLINRLSGGALGFATEAANGYMTWATTGSSAGVINFDSERMRLGADGNLSIGNTYYATLQPSALLQLHSTTKGFRLPVMTDANIAAISSPTLALQAFSTTDDRVNIKLTGGYHKFAYTSDVKRDTSFINTNADLNIGSALTTTEIQRRHHSIRVFSAVTGAAASDSDVTLPTPDVNLLGVYFYFYAVDASGTYKNTIQMGTDNYSLGDGTYASSFNLSAGFNVQISVGWDATASAYKYFLR